MTVSELIEKLRNLPGDPDLLIVDFVVTISRPYTEPPGETIRCQVNDAIERRENACRLTGWAVVGS